MNRTVESVEGLVIALRDLITTAGDGELLGGRLASAYAEERTGGGGPGLTVTIGTRRFVIQVYPTVGRHEQPSPR